MVTDGILTWLMDLLAQLGHLSALPTFVALVITASVITIVRDWRFALWALLAQYVLLGILHLRMLPPELALIKVLVGVLVCPMIYWAARWVESEREHLAQVERREIAQSAGEVPLPPLPWPMRPTNWLFRLLSILLLSLVLYSLSISLPLPFLADAGAADMGPVCIWLALIGVFILVLTSEPLPGGMGLLTLISGFELFFDALSPGLVGIGVLAAIHLLTGLALSYLILVRDLTGEVL
jgi:hypothetical protein